MRTSLFGIILLLSIGNLSAQNSELVLEHKRRSTEYILKQGHEVTISTGDNTKMYGRFIGYNSSYLFLDSDTVQLANIEYLEVKPEFSQGFGWTFIGFGTTINGFGVYMLSEAIFASNEVEFFFYYFIGGTSLVIGTVIGALGIPLLLNTKRYYVQDGGKWEIRK